MNIDSFLLDVYKKLPASIYYALSIIELSGYKAYIVGGATRDLFLGREPNDWDLATNAPLKTIKSLFPKCKIVGEAFGVALISVDNMEIQIAKFRSERGYTDYRHPDITDFNVTIKEDLKRRDFTINAVAVGLHEVFLHPLSYYDLEHGIIKTVGDSNNRFLEDPLRMLRAIRFATQLDFSIHPETWQGIKDNFLLIKKISKERIQEEINKILLSNEPKRGIKLMYESGLLSFIFPELADCHGILQNSHHKYDVFTHTLEVIENTPADLSLRLAALFHDVGKPVSMTIDKKGERHFYGDENVPPHHIISERIARDALTKLKYDKKTIEEVCILVRGHMFYFSEDISGKSIRRLLSKYGEKSLQKLIELKQADLKGSGTRDNEEVDKKIFIFKEKVKQVLSFRPPLDISSLKINGNDIMEITGLKESKKIGRIKEKLFEMVLEDPSLNDEETLKEYVYRWVKES